MPLLGNVVLTAADGKLFFKGSDLEFSFSSFVDCVQFDRPGKALVDAKLMAEIIRQLPSGCDIHLESEGTILKLTSGNFVVNLNTRSDDGYPHLIGLDLLPSATLEASHLLSMIDSVSYATASDSMREAFCNICLQAGQKGFRLVATDSLRLALSTYSECEIANLESSVVPKRSMLELKKILKPSSLVHIGVDDAFLILISERTKVAITLHTTKYSDYLQILPEPLADKLLTTNELYDIDPKELGYEFYFDVTATSFIDCLKRINLLTIDSNRIIRIDLKPGMMILRTNTPGIGDATEEIEIDYQGEGASIAVNGMRLYEMLSVESDVYLFIGGEERKEFMVAPKRCLESPVDMPGVLLFLLTVNIASMPDMEDYDADEIADFEASLNI